MKRIRILTALLLCVCLLPLSFPIPASAEDPAPAVRVCLQRLALTDRADLYLTAPYTLSFGKSEMSLPAGSSIVLQIRDGELYLFYRDAALAAGGSLTLTRNASGKEEMTGLRFEKNGNLYPGDLNVRISGGQLQCILRLSVEDYLLGVLPYEMSDSFPMEALKAQAVCARTYALSHLSPEKDWDLVDTTNDQVFKGVDPSTVNCAKAVADTAGVVCTWKDQLAVCYFAASNGGQTAKISHAWPGAEDIGCYQVKDDPYDLENPQSLIRQYVIRKDGSGLFSSLVTSLYESVRQEFTTLGFTDGQDAFRVDGITDVIMQTPRFGDGSRLMTELAVTFTASGRMLVPVETPVAPVAEDEDFLLFATPDPSAEPDPQPTPTPRLSDWIPAGREFTVVLSVFPDLIRTLNLSIYGADNEIITVAEEEDCFVLTSGRYGHGVGLSQRGAEWMAGEYGMTFTGILDFYYPGTKLKKTSAGAWIPPALDPRLAETPGPAATPTPRPTLMPVTRTDLPEDAWLAAVENIEDDSSLNLREEPSPIGTILMRLYKHQELIVLETCEDPSWVRVRTDSVEGYVMVSFLEKIR